MVKHTNAHNDRSRCERSPSIAHVSRILDDRVLVGRRLRRGPVDGNREGVCRRAQRLTRRQAHGLEPRLALGTSPAARAEVREAVAADRQGHGRQRDSNDARLVPSVRLENLTDDVQRLYPVHSVKNWRSVLVDPVDRVGTPRRRTADPGTEEVVRLGGIADRREVGEIGVGERRRFGERESGRRTRERRSRPARSLRAGAKGAVEGQRLVAVDLERRIAAADRDVTADRDDGVG